MSLTVFQKTAGGMILLAARKLTQNYMVYVNLAASIVMTFLLSGVQWYEV
jgi:hypothetical protein